MKLHRILSLALALALALADGASAQHLDAMSAEELLPLAQEEGQVAVYSFTSRIAKVETAFEAAYPGIDLIASDMSSTEQITRLKAEADAGIVNADVIYISDVPVVFTELLQAGLLEAYVPPRIADRLDGEFKSPLLAQRLSTKVLMYNEEAHPDGAPVSNLWELTTDDWRGRVIMVDPLQRGDYLDLRRAGAARPAGPHADARHASLRDDRDRADGARLRCRHPAHPRGERGWIVEPARRNAGLVFQSYALWPHMTVAGNVDWPLKVAGRSKGERAARVGEVLSLLAIDALAHRYPNEISGGQQQRVAIARMIAPRPGILLFDEPLSNLDAKLRVEMRTELLKVHRATGATSVYVTHDQVEAMTMATHVAVMNNGRIEQFGAPEELVSDPATAFVATFVGTPPANLVPVAAADIGVSLAGQGLPASFASDRTVYAMYRPQDLCVSAEPTGRSIPAEFAEASPMAGRVMITGIAGDLRLTAVVDHASRFALGDIVHFGLPPRPAAIFSGDGARLA